jgi:uncharacterized protein (TIGR02246 family)
MWIVFVVVGLLAAPAVWAQAPAPGLAEEAAVRAVIARYVSAREARDSSAIEALFTADADQYTTGGDWRRGRGQLIPGMAASSKQNPGERGITVAAVRFITPDVAIADGPYEIAGSDARRWTTIVLRRETDGWRIAAIRNMTPGRRSGAAAPY